MTLVLDTSVLVEIERKNSKIINQLTVLSTKYVSEPSITFASFFEFYYGFLKKFPSKKELAIKELSKYKVLNTTATSAICFAELKFNCERKGVSVSVFDLLIASIVIDSRLILVTLDNGFSKVSGLSVITLEN